jgi:hypothetical protein
MQNPIQNLWESEENIFDILHDYYSKLDKFADDVARAARLSDPTLEKRARALADLVESYEGALSVALYPLLDDGPHPARSFGMASVHASSLADMLRNGLNASRAPMLRRTIDGYLQRVHAPIISAAKMRFAREKALAVGRAVREALSR